MKKIFHFLIEYYSRVQRYVCLIIACIILLCACQKKTLVMTFTDESSIQFYTKDLQVIDGKYQDAIERCQNWLQKAEQDSFMQADIYSALGGIYAEYLLDQETAYYYLDKAIKIHQDQMDKIGVANDYSEMSKIYIHIGGSIDKGVSYLEDAENIYIKYNAENTFGFAEILMNKGRLYQRGEKYLESLDVLNRAKLIYDEKQENSITLYLLIGKSYLGINEYELAEEQYLTALQICQEENDEYMMSGVFFQLGWLYECINENVKAVEYYTKSLEISRTLNPQSQNVAATYNNLAFSYARIPDMEKALEASTKACQIIEKVTPITSKTIKSKENYKLNLSVYWSEWYESTSKSELENWYQEIVIEEKAWNNYGKVD